MAANPSTLVAAKAAGVPLASFENKILRMEPGQGLAEKIPAAMAKAWLVFPLFLDGRTLAVAFADPSDLVLVKDVEKAVLHPIEVFSASREELLQAIAKSYR
ncbi:hypothetical protein EPO15_00095 [bacterium]|nr:MAG: hypothetical protein EPO15_00095 [bacterium]